MLKILYEEPLDIWRTLLIGLVGYITLVFLLRLSGKRTLSKMDPFDFVITTALGSTLGHSMIDKHVPLITTLSAFILLIGLQFVTSYWETHSKALRGAVKGAPTLLYYEGEYQRRAMSSEHVPEMELLAAVREKGISDMKEVKAIVLESNSEFSVIKYGESGLRSSLEDVSDEPRKHEAH
jgi:uncharacterized membrane protein YcaP (DUF421 family)